MRARKTVQLYGNPDELAGIGREPDISYVHHVKLLMFRGPEDVLGHYLSPNVFGGHEQRLYRGRPKSPHQLEEGCVLDRDGWAYQVRPFPASLVVLPSAEATLDMVREHHPDIVIHGGELPERLPDTLVITRYSHKKGEKVESPYFVVPVVDGNLERWVVRLDCPLVPLLPGDDRQTPVAHRLLGEAILWLCQSISAHSGLPARHVRTDVDRGT